MPHQRGAPEFPADPKKVLVLGALLASGIYIGGGALLLILIIVVIILLVR